MKGWKKRLTETWAFIDGCGFPAGQVTALKNYHSTLTNAQKQAVSLAMAQGGYTPGVAKPTEKLNRHWRRALVLVLMARKNSGNVLNDLTVASQALLLNLTNDAAKKRVEFELANLNQALMRMQANGLAPLTWGGWDGTRQRPLLAGCAIGRRGENGPGTLGCFVVHNVSHDVYILSNRHVLRQATGLGLDNEIIQPPHQLGGSYFDVVADYTAEFPSHDAAIAKVQTGITCDNTTPEGVAITGSAVVATGAAVRKRGCASRERRGTVTDDNSANVNAMGHVLIDQLLVARDALLDPLADHIFQIQGDSGSVVLDHNNAVVALMHGQADADTGQATHIAPILAHFNVSVLVGQVVAP